MQACHGAWFLNTSRSEWLQGAELSDGLEMPSAKVFWLERIAVWLAVDFQIHAPMLFALAAPVSYTHLTLPTILLV